jgi:hypothetical protein
VGGDDRVVVPGEPELPHHLLRHEPMARAVEPVAAHLVPLEPLVGERVEIGARRHGLVERGVEHRHLRQRREELLRDPDAEQVGRVVERPEGDARLDPRDHLSVDRHRARELGPAVHHPVTDPAEPVREAERPQEIDRGAERAVVIGARDRLRLLLPVQLPVERGRGRPEPLRDAGGELAPVPGIDHRELRGGAAAVQDEHVHARFSSAGAAVQRSTRWTMER